MFAERLGQILSGLEVSPAEMAHYMEIDPSNISRMLTGKRVLKNGGEAAWRLVRSIVSYAKENGKTDALCTLIGCEDVGSADRIRSRTMSWLYEGIDTVPKKAGPPKDRVPYRAFGEKLNAVMELAGLSNIRFGKLINVDTSYISRFRNGLRSPKSNPKTMHTICSVLMDRLYEQDKIGELGALMNATPEALKDEREAFDLFYSWLFDTGKEDSSSVVEKLLENIDSFSLETKIPLPSFEEAADKETLLSNESVYYGFRGLQTAVIRFLGNAIQQNAKELCLYSDQDMDWMVGDPVFLMKWSALMLECVKHGIRIRIIHNIDRDLHEMIDAITNWLPLYMSGMIESYYCIRQKNTRFSHTLFLCPGMACVEGSNVNGQEEQHGIYRYHTDAAMLKAYRQLFGGLLTDSRHLVRIYSNFDEAVKKQVQAGDHLYTLSDAPFANTQISITENAVAVSKRNAPQVTFLISHPAMVKAFKEYTDQLRKQ